MTQNELKKILHYDKDTGVFSKVRDSIKYKSGYVYCGISNAGYPRIRINKKQYMAHRLAWLYVYGYMPNLIDHIDGNKSNNVISNLRECNKRQNALNRTAPKNSQSGVKGVRKIYSNKYVSRACVNGEQYHLGTFKTIEEAIEARKLFMQSQPDYVFDRT